MWQACLLAKAHLRPTTGLSFYFLAQTRYIPFMARPLRIQYEGAVYHITSRGNAQRDSKIKTIKSKVYLEY